MAPPRGDKRRQLGALLRSVVKVLTVSDAPDYEQPWQTQGPANSSGSGVIVESKDEKCVLTNAHCVENAVYIEVRRYGKATKYPAAVEALGHECDLALLRVKDPSFFGSVQGIPMGTLPHLSDVVSVCGYPIGGERLSITRGIVSRIDLVRYAQSQRRLLAVQIDAAINAGNSGGPVVQDGRLVGIAFQTLDEADQIGYVIAAPVIEHFLSDFANGVYDGFPGLGVVTQPLESAAHRRALGIEASGIGVLVTRVAYSSSAWKVLWEGDVLLEVDGVPIKSDGTVPLREGEIIDWTYIVSKRQVDEQMPVKVWRKGTVENLVVLLKPPRYLVAEDAYDVKPTFYIFGGLLFAPLTRDYMKTWEDPWWQNAPRDLLALYERGIPSPDCLQPVVLQKVLADQVNQGYHDLESVQVEKVQGEPVRSLRALVEIVEASDDPFVCFTTTDHFQIVIDRAQAVERHDEILERFGVPTDRSPDLRSTA